jgi:hypothetical protein
MSARRATTRVVVQGPGIADDINQSMLGTYRKAGLALKTSCVQVWLVLSEGLPPTQDVQRA